MLEQFNFKEELTLGDANDKTFFTASNGSGYISAGELHICANYHLIYKFSDGKGWYMVNPETQIAYPLGEGASPSVVVCDIEVTDKEYFDSILYVQEEQATSKKRKQ